MRLYLVRHCEASSGFDDAARALSERGRDQARRLASFLPRVAGTVDEIRHSGLVRARETAEALAATLRPARGVVQMRGITPDDSPRDAADLLRFEDGVVLVVSHLPLVAHVASLLLGGRVDGEPLAFRTGSVAALDGEGMSWHLDWLVHPDLLPPAARPAD